MTRSALAGALASATAIATLVWLGRRRRRAALRGRRSDAPITHELVAKYPGRMAVGRSLIAQPSWESEHTLLYLKAPPGETTQRMYRHDLRDGTVTELLGGDHVQEANISAEEKQRRERLRMLSTGITTYSWAADDAALLVPVANELFVSRGGAPLRRLFDPSALPGAIVDPRLSDDGATLGFVCEAEVYVVPTAGAAVPVQVTSGARGTARTNGVANYIAQEELDRLEGWWLSPDGALLAFEESEEAHIETYRIMHLGSDQVGKEAQEDHHYPFAGAENPRCRLGVTALSGGGVVWMDTSMLGADGYLARVKWLKGPGGAVGLVAVLLDRLQSEMVLVRYDLRTGAPTVLLREASEWWVNFEAADTLVPLRGGEALLFSSERSGQRHLYVHGYAEGQASAPLPLTAGEWHVDGLGPNFVHEAGGEVFFLANRGDARQRHLFAVQLPHAGRTPAAGAAPIRQVTAEPGYHACVINEARTRCIDSYSAAAHPYRVVVRSLADGAVLSTLFDAAVATPELARMALVPPAFETLPSTDGRATLHMATYAPPAALFGAGPHPLVVSCYGGPHVQYVRDAWEASTADLRAQALAAQGYLVMKLDNRGSARRGIAFEGAVRHDMGNLEVADQEAGVRRLVAQGRADPARVGIYGWSYGGYLSAMCLARAPDTFKAAVAGAPVTHWDGYDTCYTERYMSTPQLNPKGYEASAVMTHAGGMRGALMLVHGLIDENVHFRHTARLVQALIKAQKPHELLLFPSERHLPRALADRTYMEERIFDFLRRNL